MNHVYRLKRSGFNQQLQAVPENTRSASKGVSTGKTIAQTVTATLASFALSGMTSLVHAQQAPPAVNQLPQGGVVTRGTANINNSTTPAGNALMTVNQGSNRAVIDWASFNVGSQAKVQFNQPSSSAVVLNNILGNNASQIYGQISANGQVFLSNPNGVYFSPTAQVNVGGLVATTGKANADEFMAGQAIFNRDGSTGSVINQGQLTSYANGYVALLAPEVRNQGIVIAQAGTVALASGEAITLSFNNAGTGLTGITTTPQAIAALVENRSAVLAQGGQIILSAHALATLQGSVVKNSGQLNATSLIEKGGKIVLMGDNIELTGTSQITANGPQGGGTVLVGGDWQGKGDTRQAVQVTMAQGASIEANATDKGDGGKVVLWSDIHNASGLTQVDGRIEAKGAGSGNKAGNGGQVETSGHTLNVGESTRVSTQATGQGKSGQWLLDPVDFNINSGSGGQTTSSIGATTLATNLRSTDVIIATDASTTGFGDINVNAAVSPVMDLADHTLTLQAHRNINIKASIDATTSVSSIYKLNVLFKSVGNIVQYNPLDATALVAVKTNGGDATYWSNSNNANSGAIQIGTVGTFATASVVTNGGNIVLGGGLPSSGNNNIPDGYAFGTIGVTLNDYSVLNTTATGVAGTINVRGSSNSSSGKGVQIGWSYGYAQLTGGEVSITGVSTHAVSPSSGIDIVRSTSSISSSGAITLNGTGGSATTVTPGAYLQGNISSSGGAININGTTSGTRAAIQLLNATLNAAGTDITLTAVGGMGIAAQTGTSFGQSGSTTQNVKFITDQVSFPTSGSKVSVNAYGEWSIVPYTLSTGFTNYVVLDYVDLGTTLTGLRINSIGTSGLMVSVGPSSSSTASNFAGSVNGPISITGGYIRLNGALATTNTTTGDITLTSNASTSAYPNSSNINGTINLATGRLLTINQTGSTASSTSSTLAGVISGAGAVKFQGAGTILMTSTNTYSGSTTVDDGVTLQLGVSTTGSTTGSFDSSSSLAIGNNSTLVISRSNDVNLTMPISGVSTSRLSKLLTSKLTLSGDNSSYAGGITVSAGTLTLGSSTPWGSGSVVTVASGAAMDLSGQTVTNTNNVTLINGTGLASSPAGVVFNSSSSAASYAGLLTLTGNSTIKAGSGAIALTNPGTITGAYNLTLDGSFGGSVSSVIGTITSSTSSTALTLTTGTWSLSGSNTFSGATNITGGSLQITGAGRLGTGGTYSGWINIVSGSSLVYSSSGDQTLGGIISGAGTVTKDTSTSSTLTLTANNTYSGATTINAGTFKVGGGGYLGSANYSAPISIASGASFSYASTYTAQNLLSIISGAGSFIKEFAPGALTLSGNNTYTGGTTVSAGILKVGHLNALGDPAGAVTVNAGGALDLWGKSLTNTNPLTLSGTGVSSGGALMNSSATAASYAGLVTLGAASSIVGESGTIALTNSGTISGAFDMTLGGAKGGSIDSVIGIGSGRLTKQGSGTWTLGATNTYSGVTTISAGTLAVTNNNGLGSTANGTVIESGATLELRSVIVGNEAVSFGGVSTAAGGVLLASGGTSSLAGSLTITTPYLTSPAINVTGTQLTLSGVISTTGGISYGVKKQGTGTLVLSGANTYIGSTLIEAGILRLGSSISPIGAQTGGDTTVSSGAALDLNGYSISPSVTLFLNGTGINSGGALMNSGAAATWQSPITLSSNSSIVADGGTIALTGNIAGAGKALTLDGSAGGTLSGVIANASGSTTLTKQGTGIWTLLGASTFSGGTTVSAGTLKAGASTTGSVTNGPFGTGAITVNGGTLDLNGKTLANALTLNGGGNTGALLNSSGTAATSSGAVSIATATTLGGSGNVTMSGVISGATSGLAFVGTGNYTLTNATNTLSTIASGSSIGPLSVVNAGALTIGQVTVAGTGSTTYSGISSTGTVSVTTNSGDLTVSQNISTSSTSSNTSSPALKLSAGASTAAGTATGGDVVLSGSPSISVGSGGIAAIYSGNYSSASSLNTLITAQTSNYSLFNSGASTLPASGQGFYGIYRGSNAVPIYLLAVSGQSSEYGTAPILKYAYSTSPTSIVSTSITGIPSGELSFTLTGGSVSQSVSVSSGVTGTIALTGTPSISSTGLVSTTSVGAYALTLTPSLTLTGYSFAAGTNPVTFTINPKPITVTGVTGVNKVYDGGLSATLNGSLQGVLSADASSVTFNGTGTFASKNVGNTIAITSSSTLSGAASGNYALTQPTGMTANITRLNSVTWTGGATGDWLNPANWAGGAVPDKSNVANVVIPAGKTVSFNNVVTGTAEAGSVNVDGITGSTGSLTVSAGTLAVGSSGVTLSNLTQTGGTFSTQGAMSLGSGSLSVSAANYSLGAVSTSGAFSVTNSGGDVTLSGNLTGGNSTLLIKSTGNIIQNASTAVSTTGGNITYWADSDASGAGYIALNSGTSAATKASVSAGAGNIVFGGGNGATAADGQATGIKGIALGSYASLSGANITLVGRGSASTVGSLTSGTVGVEVADYASVVGTGAVAITGTGGGGSAASTSNSNIGVQIGVQFGSTTVESTGNSVAITGAGGGTGSASLNNFGVFLTGMRGTSSTVRTAAGDLTIRGTEGAGTTTTGYNRNSGIYLYGDVQLGDTSQTGALNLLANDVLWPMMATAKMQTAGAVTIAPISTSFVTEQRMGTNVLLTGTPASLTIGKVGNTAALNLLTPMIVAGPISLMGGPISLNANLTSTGLISLKSYGGTAGIQQGLPGLGTPWGIITAPLVSVTATNNPVVLGNDNAIGTVAVTGASNVRVVNAGALTVGSAGGVTGISASGTVVAITNTGDLTIAGNIATTSTSSYVMNIEAGFNANPGDSTGGNIVLTNASTVTTGLNATARLYSGSLAGSTALAAYVGAGTGHFRYGSDGTTSNFTQAVTSGLNLIYREKPTVSWSNEADQSIVYGQSMTYSTTGSLNTYSATNSFALGLQNGDEAKVSQALLVRTTVAPKTTAQLNSSNVYDAGVYEVSKTAAAEALGYAAANPKITVTQAPLAITAKDASKVYDGGAYSLGNGLNYSGFITGESTSVLGGSAVYGGAAQGAINAGTYALTVSGLTAKNYSITYNPGTLTVSSKPLTIRVNDDARFVGQSDTAGYAGASYTGFVTGESIATLGSLSITRTATSAAGTYVGALQASIPGLTNTNYNITYTPGNYTIVPADQLLIKLNNVATTYGTDPVYAVTSAQYLKSGTNVVIDLTSRASISGSSFSLTDGDGGTTSFTVGAQSASLSTSGQLNAYGGYQLGASSVNNSSTNYNNTITTTGALTVNPKTVSASVGSGLTKTYDGNASMPSMSVTLSGALAGDKVSATGQGVYASANAGTTNYDVKNLVLSGVDQANYVLTAGNSISGTNGVINKAALVITSQNDRKIFDGEAYVGGNGVTYSGLVNNEEPSVLGGTLSYTGTSQNAVNAGTYTITPQGLSSTNYNLTYVNAPLTIDPATITTSTVNALLQGPITKVYDGTDTATLTSSNYILSGWVGTDTASVTKTAGTYDNPNAGSGKLVSVSLSPGDYLAGAGTNLANYVLPTSIFGAVGRITPKPVSVSGLTAANKTYDGNTSVAISNWGSVATGIANENLILLSGTASFANANAQNNKTVTATGYSLADGVRGLASNYVLSNSVGTTTADISTKAVTIAGTGRTTTYDATSTYSDLSNTTGFVANGLVQGDWVTSVNKTLGGTGVPPTGIAQAGTYTVMPSSAVMGLGNASNYTFSYTAASNTVDQANLAVSATPSLTGNVYRGTAYTGTYTTTALGSDASALTVTGVATGIDAGTYSSGLSVSGAVLSNYNTPVITNANLVISPKAVSVSNTARSTTYDGTSSYGALASGTAFTTSALVGSDAVASVTQTASGTGVTPTGIAQAGNFTVAPSAALLSTGQLSNYTFSYAASTHTVNPLVLTETVISGTLQGAVVKLYDGSNAATLNSGNFLLSGWVGAEGAVVTKTSGTYDNANAGVGKTVTVNLTSADYSANPGTSLSNYTLPSTISGAVGSINKAPLKVQVNNDAKFVTQSDSAGYSGVSYSGWVAGETVSVLGGTVSVVRSAVGPDGNTSTSNSSVGNYTGVLTASGLTSNNYAITYAAGNYTVVPADQLLVRVAPLVNTYGSIPNYIVSDAKYLNRDNVIVDLTGNVSRSGNNFTVTDGVGGSASFTVIPVAAAISGAGMLSTGSYQLQPSSVMTASNNFNNQLTLIGSQVVSAAPLSLSFSAANKLYDGKNVATLTSSDNRLTGDVFNVSAMGTFIDKNAGTGKAVSVTGVKVSGRDASNYIINANASTTADITRIPSVTWVGGATGSWYDPANWSGGVVPDLENVISVMIPEGVTVTPMLINVPPKEKQIIAPAVLPPQAVPEPKSYQVTLIQPPQANLMGILHIELPIVARDVQLSLPVVLQNWIAAAGSNLEFEGLSVGALEGVNLTDRGAIMNLLASVDRRSPLEFVMRSAREQVKVRIVWKP